jgi:hypothetical protein
VWRDFPVCVLSIKEFHEGLVDMRLPFVCQAFLKMILPQVTDKVVQQNLSLNSKKKVK